MRTTFRILRRSPTFSAACILTLALGIGANTAMFSLVNAVLVRPLPFGNSNQLVWLWHSAWDRERGVFSVPDFLDFQGQARSLDGIAAFTIWGANLTGQPEPERLQGMRISGNAFDVLGVEAQVGRALIPDDESPGSTRVVVLGDGLWHRDFGGDPAVVGRTILLNGEAYTVVGVLPGDFVFPLAESELAIPLWLHSDPRKGNRDERFLRGIARLKAGVSAGQAQAEMNAINEHLRQQFPDTNAKTVGVKVVPLQEELVGSFRLALMVLLGAVGVVLLIACSNLANLMLVRATARRKELALRVALGGSRARVVRQLLGESLTLALLGGMLAIATAPAGLRLILAAIPAQLPNRQGITIDVTVLWFTLAVALIAGILTGLTPGISMPNVDLVEELKEGGRSSAETRRGWRTRGLLVVLEVGLSMVLLVVAGLLVKSFARLEHVDSGFDESKVLTVRLSLPPTRYRAPGSITVFQDEFLKSVRQFPGVASVGLVSILPMSGLNPSVEYTVVGQPPKSMAELPEVLYRMVTPYYFQAMRIRLEEGRDFTDQDKAGGHEVAIVNQTMARRYWSGRTAVGQHLRLDDAERPQREVEIIGVVADVKHVSLEGKPTTDVYVPYRQIPAARMTWATNNMYVVVRTANDPLSMARAVRNSLRAVDSEVPAANTRTMEQYVASSVAPRRFSVLVLAIFAAVALLLAGTGLYGVISYAVTQRTHEIGVRIALGARRSDVIRMVVAQAMGLVLVGEAIGAVGAVAITSVLSGMLFAVRTSDPATFATAAIVLVVVAGIASYLPARRAATGDPLLALRFR